MMKGSALCFLLLIAATAEAHAAAKIGRASVAGVSVSGLTPGEARRRLTRELDRKLSYPHILTDGRKTTRRQRRHLGARLDVDAMVKRARSGEKHVPLLLKVDAYAMQRALRRLAPYFHVTGKNARVGEWRGKVVIIPQRNWSRVDVARSAWALAPRLQKNPALRYLRLTTKTTAPPLTAARLKGINGVLARYTTRFNPGNVKRTRNMRIAINTINGTLLSPGEVFSLNQVVGERTQARGYRTSIVFNKGHKVPGIGAGVSQVTGTIFNAALLAGLPIVTYRTHSRPVDYIPLGRDATVAWGQFDMKFKNNTSAPVYIRYEISGNRATAILFGKKKPGQRVSLIVRSQRRGPREITAQLYRTIRKNGKVVMKHKVGSSHYKWNVSDWYD